MTTIDHTGWQRLPGQTAAHLWLSKPDAKSKVAACGKKTSTKLEPHLGHGFCRACEVWVESQPASPPAHVADVGAQTSAGDYVPELVPLGQLDDNPYQTRQVYDEEKIGEIAASIKQHGLLQAPIGRRVAGGRVQLAFGHTRRRSFDRLAAEDATWSTMPVLIRELDDETMALHAWSENKDRKDISAYEEARAIEHYTAAFGWNQKQVAEKLGLDRSTVSNKLRLLRLPQQALEQLQAGELSERQAAALLPLMELPPQALERTANNIYIEGKGYLRTAQDLITYANQIDSVRLRKGVDEVIEKITIDLAAQPWAKAEVTVAGVINPTCKDCPIKLKNNRCAEQQCAGMKLVWWRGQQAQAAAAAAGLPVRTPANLHSAIDNLSGANLDRLRAQAEATRCGNLGVVAGDTYTYFPHKVDGHKDCGIICAHGIGKKCTCKLALDRSKDPEASTKAKERHDKQQIKEVYKEPAERALAAALATPSAGLWTLILQRLSYGAKPKGQDLEAVLAAIAAELVKEVIKYDYECGVNLNGARKHLEEMLKKIGVAPPWAAEEPEPPTNPQAALRAHLAEARSFAGMGMAHHFLGLARDAYSQVVSRVHDPATLEALAREIDQVAEFIAQAEAGDAGETAAAPTAPDVGAQTPGAAERAALTANIAEAMERSTPATFAEVTGWLDQLQACWDAGYMTLGDETVLEQLSGLHEQLSDDTTIPDADYEATTRRIDDMADQLMRMGVS